MPSLKAAVVCELALRSARLVRSSRTWNTRLTQMSGGTIRTLVAVDSGVDAHAVEHAFPAGAAVQVTGVVEGLERGWSVLEESSPDLLVVACAGYSERALYLIEAASKQRPERPVVVLFYGVPDGFLNRAFEMGADDRGSAARTVRVASIAGRALSRVVQQDHRAHRRQALTDPVAVDLDLQFGDVGIAMGLSPDRTIYDLARVGSSLDPDKAEDFLTQHASGARVLLAPSRPDQAGTVTVEFLRELYAVLRARHDFVIVDTPPGFTPEVIASIDLASDLLVVGMLDALSLKDTKLGLETLTLMGVAPERIRLVLNRADTSVGIKRSEAEAILGRTPDVFVPSDRQIPRATTDGQPIVVASGRSEAARAFHGLADLYLQDALVAGVTASNGNGNGNGNASNGDGEPKRRRRRSKRARS